MADSTKSSLGSQQTTAAHSSSTKGNGKTKNRRVYDHEMTERERWALQVVLKAKGACATLAIAIQEGKPVSPQVIARCSDLISAAGEMIFAD